MSHHRSFTCLAAIGITVGLMLSWAKTAQAQSHYPYYESRAYPTAHAAPMAYQYMYYPSAQVYYAPHNRFWYWYDGYSWQSAYALPYAIRVDFRLGGIPITLRSALPYREHHYVDSYYGRPWRAHQRRQQERRDWREHEVWRESGRGYPRYDAPRYERDDEREHHRHR
ncbi:MAG: hypothetical protein E6Q34_06675 [Burkholderiaceae bacterium]|nr:MAG: hypothetical protein E6Q34_06675 [Burkholderiaceae bacterium]